MIAMRLDYDIVDVFAQTPFAGNQLAVVHDAGGLTADRCLAIAREFGYSETTFPEPLAADRYSTRIFTPDGEIPFAGHPTLGTAWVLRRRGLLSADRVVQHCGAGEIGVAFTADVVRLSAPPRDLAGPLSDDLVAELLGDLGLTPADRAGEAWVAGCGLSWVHLPVVEAAIVGARSSRRRLEEYGAALFAGCADPMDGVNLFALDAGPPVAVHARVFVPGLGIPEDPATGSAAVGLGMALAVSGVLPEGGEYVIDQGLEIGRPSRLFGRVEATGGRPTRCHVAGRVHGIATGRIEVP